MKHAEEIERSLKRLAPAALSEEATDSIESMIDSLARPESSGGGTPGEPRPDWRKPAAWMSLAAAVVIGCIAAFALIGNDPQPLAGDPGSAVPEAGLEWVGRTDRVEETVDGGLMADDDGRMHRLLRYRVVEEEVIRDGRNGMIMRVTGPRDEMMLVPVSTF